MNTKHPKYSIRFLQSESRLVICPAQHGETGSLTFEQAKFEARIRNAKPQNAPRSTARYETAEKSSGLGICGYGSDDYSILTEHDTVSYPERTGCKWGGTRYDEQCAGCGRITAICNDCELCRNCHD